ncbi:Multidrug resistance protein EbrB [compost metagenome]
MFVFYAASFTFLNYTIKTIDISIAYAVWSGLGAVIITIIGIYRHISVYPSQKNAFIFATKTGH